MVVISTQLKFNLVVGRSNSTINHNKSQ